MNTDFVKNPFVVKSPEDIHADEANRLFVNVLSDFQKVEQAGHVMLNGPRGCGKSMMFRFLQADCQLIHRKCNITDLPFLGILIRIRNTSPNLTELRRLADSSVRNVLNEHFLTMYVASVTFKYLSDLAKSTNGDSTDAREYYERFCSLAQRAGARSMEAFRAGSINATDALNSIHEKCDDWYHQTISYARSLVFGGEARPSFTGPICGYMDFLNPLLCDLKKLNIFPRSPVYLLIDDADLLSHTQCRVLNSWIATRTSAEVSLKVSTQLGYRTFRTTTGATIDSPHDFSEINVVDVYTTGRGRYMERVREILRRRLKNSGVEQSPDDFFPTHAPQEKRIAEIGMEIRSGKHELSGQGYRIEDDVTRYARPEYFRELSGTSKSTPSYYYAGFEQLVHISSGLIRYFLEPAALMFGEQQSKNPSLPVLRIDPVIQHEMISRAAEELMTTQFMRLSPDDPEVEECAERLTEFQQKKILLRNLIEVLGGTFRAKLISRDVERRVFSVAFSDNPDSELVELFELGVRAGYFQRKTIGNKDGTGRTPLYILTRRLAPYFKLDPSSFAGYLHVTAEKLWAAIRHPRSTLREIKLTGAGTLSNAEGQLQLSFD